MMLAARHHDATGHPTECEQTIIVRYGDHAPPRPNLPLAPRVKLSGPARAEVQARMRAAARGGRAALAAHLADLHDVSVGTVYRVAELGQKRRGAPSRPEYREWVRTVVALRRRAPKPVPIDLAIEAGVAGGSLPPEALAMPVATVRRIARELGLVDRGPRTQPLVADWPMQALLFDGSTSEHLAHVRGTGDDAVLRLHRNPLPKSGYKNKPLSAERLRVVLYAAWDMCTGCWRARYGLALGESGADAAKALCLLLEDTGDPHRPMHGVPSALWTDQGPLFKSGPCRDLLERLDVDFEPGAPYHKERMGGVERGWRTMWTRFERSLFLTGREEWTVGCLNRRLVEYEVRENQRPARTPVDGRRVGRAVAWAMLLPERPEPLRQMPPEAWRTLARDKRVRIDSNGQVRWDRKVYEHPEWHGKWVTAWRALDGTGDLVLEDPATGERSAARLYERRPHGVVRAAPATPLDRLDAEPAPDAADPYAPGGPRPAVVGLAPPSEPPAPLDDPLALAAPEPLGRDEGLKAFLELWPWATDAADREAIADRIEAGGLDRDGVAALAAELMPSAREAL